ncbi:MAG: flagellar basal body rod protein FlgB [Thermodesulfobacteriota bacterium]|nr:flagellar basal body rod protein FlgB [Thermodesulfobacteriota bacterium]
MDSHGIFGRPFSTVEKVLDLRSVKHNLIASNIANSDTPNYRAFDLIIQEELGKSLQRDNITQLKRTQPDHLPATKVTLDNTRPKIVATSPLTPRGDGNTVDIDEMMAKLSENSLHYTALAQILSKKFTALKYAIEGGKR